MAMMDDDKDFGRTPDLNADAPGRRRGGKKRVCKFCADKAVGHRLQGPAGAQVLRLGARQGRSAPHQRQLRASPAQGDARDQARAQHRAPCPSPSRAEEAIMATTLQVILQTRRRQRRQERRARQGSPGLRAQLPHPARPRRPGDDAPRSTASTHEKAVARREGREDRRRSAQVVAEKINALKVTIARPVGEDDKLFGSVTVEGHRERGEGRRASRSIARRCTSPSRSRRSAPSRSR